MTFDLNNFINTKQTIIILFTMGSTPSSTQIHSLAANQLITPANCRQNNLKIHPQKVQTKQITKKQSLYQIPQLQQSIAKAHRDLHSKDPIGKKRYYFQFVNFIFEWLHRSMSKGMTLFDAQNIVNQDLMRACKDYPIGKIQNIQTTIKDVKPAKMPNSLQGLKNLNKQKFTDRIKQHAIRSKQISYEFNKQMQLILQKQGGYKFKGGYKSTGIKAYMRILTKILDNFLSSSQGSKQVYTDMDHYFWTPIFINFNKVIDSNISNIKVDVFDWIRCRVFYKNITDLQSSYKRLTQAYGKDIFRVKNRINLNTRDVLINLKFKDEFAQIQLALSYDSSAYDFNHKLYELTRQKLGVAYCCFTILLNDVGQSQISTQGVMTKSGYIKKTLLREKVQIGFQRLTFEDTHKQWDSTVSLLDQWDVIALQSGTIRGHNFEERISKQLYGPQISQMMVIKRIAQDPVMNWLNWMK